MFFNHTVTKIELLHNPIDVYDLEIEETNNFIANELCVHNSSDRPNLQNVDYHKHPEIRTMFSAPKGKLLMALDYSAAEVRGIAMISRDKNLVKVIKENLDMHGHWAKKLFNTNEKDKEWI